MEGLPATPKKRPPTQTPKTRTYKTTAFPSFARGFLFLAVCLFVIGYIYPAAEAAVVGFLHPNSHPRPTLPRKAMRSPAVKVDLAFP